MGQIIVVKCAQKDKGTDLKTFQIQNGLEMEGKTMRGYFTANGYYGLVDGKYRLFASESDYFEAVSGENEED